MTPRERHSLPLWLVLASIVAVVAVARAMAPATAENEEDGPRLPFAEDTPPGTGARPIEVTEDGPDHRLVRHAGGVTRVHARPRRICALTAADELLAIGITPVGHSINDGNFPDYLAQALARVPWVPTVYGVHLPNMEAVIATRPDLIITRTLSLATYHQLSQIAPTVVLTHHLEHYRQRVLDVGAITGRRREAEARVIGYNAKVAAARAALDPVLRGGSIAMMRVRPGVYRLHGGDHHIDPVLYDDLAVARPRLIQDRRWGSSTSPEAILHLDADWIIVATDVEIGSLGAVADLLGHPVWRRLPATRAGRVSLLSHYRHWADSGILGRARSIDDVLRAVAPEALASVNAEAEAAYRGALD